MASTFRKYRRPDGVDGALGVQSAEPYVSPLPALVTQFVGYQTISHVLHAHSSQKPGLFCGDRQHRTATPLGDRGAPSRCTPQQNPFKDRPPASREVATKGQVEQRRHIKTVTSEQPDQRFCVQASPVTDPVLVDAAIQCRARRQQQDPLVRGDHQRPVLIRVGPRNRNEQDLGLSANLVAGSI